MSSTSRVLLRQNVKNRNARVPSIAGLPDTETRAASPEKGMPSILTRSTFSTSLHATRISTTNPLGNVGPRATIPPLRPDATPRNSTRTCQPLCGARLRATRATQHYPANSWHSSPPPALQLFSCALHERNPLPCPPCYL